MTHTHTTHNRRLSGVYVCSFSFSFAMEFEVFDFPCAMVRVSVCVRMCACSYVCAKRGHSTRKGIMWRMKTCTKETTALEDWFTRGWARSYLCCMCMNMCVCVSIQVSVLCSCCVCVSVCVCVHVHVLKCVCHVCMYVRVVICVCMYGSMCHTKRSCTVWSHIRAHTLKVSLLRRARRIRDLPYKIYQSAFYLCVCVCICMCACVLCVCVHVCVCVNAMVFDIVCACWCNAMCVCVCMMCVRMMCVCVWCTFATS